MRTSSNRISAITLFVGDLNRAKAFYADVLGGTVVHEDDEAVTFELENLMLNLLRIGAAPPLIAPRPVGTGEDGARWMLSIFVADIGGVCAALTAAGIELVNGPVDRDWGMRTAVFADPDGHLWELAQPIP